MLLSGSTSVQATSQISLTGFSKRFSINWAPTERGESNPWFSRPERSPRRSTATQYRVSSCVARSRRGTPQVARGIVDNPIARLQAQRTGRSHTRFASIKKERIQDMRKEKCEIPGPPLRKAKVGSLVNLVCCGPGARRAEETVKSDKLTVVTSTSKVSSLPFAAAPALRE
jgi:hypothetical protein